MALHVQSFPQSLDELPRFLDAASSASETAGGMAGEADAIELIGPFPAYTADPREIAAGNWEGVAQSGWRALVHRNGEPLRVLGIVEMEQGPGFSLRDADAAAAFASVLERATSLEDEGRDYEVRWFSLPAIYLTALWLKGNEDLFLPTRAGSAERIEPSPVGRARIEQMAADLVPQFSPRSEGGQVSNLEFAQEGVTDDPDTRSGL